MEREQPEKRTRMSGEERHALMLNRAKEIFASRSYPEASTGELARASDVTEPMLYKHFGSKKGLFLEVLAHFGERFFLMWSECVEQRAEKDLLEALEQVIMDYCRTIKSDPAIQKVFFQAIVESVDPEVAQRVRRHNQRVYTLIHQLIERAQRAGYLAADLDLNSASWGYMSMVCAKQYSLMLDLDDELNDRVLAEMNRLWLQALRVEKH